MNSPAYFQCRRSSQLIWRLASLTKIWGRSWLYAGPHPNTVLLAADEIPDMEPQLLAVVGPLSCKELVAFIKEQP